jgi:hypothetical protein
VLEAFQPLVGSEFKLHLGPDQTLPAHLIEAQPIRSAAAPEREPFSLVFKGPAEPLLPQCIYRLEHPSLDALDVFLVPIRRTPEGVQYEAVFN